MCCIKSYSSVVKIKIPTLLLLELDNSDNTIHMDRKIKFRHSVGILIFVPVCLLILRGLNPDSVITNQHIFLFFSNSFLLVAGCWLTCSHRRKVKNVRTHCQKFLIFTRQLTFRTGFCGTRKQSSLKPINRDCRAKIRKNGVRTQEVLLVLVYKYGCGLKLGAFQCVNFFGWHSTLL